MAGSSARISRRRVLKAGAGAIVAGGLALAGGSLAAPRASASRGFSKPGNHHLAWVWQFDADGSPEQIRDQLAFIGAGILLKTHDGTEWMARWDHSGRAVDGGRAVQDLRNFFEYGGVPFHAWAVVKGLDPIREAQMAAEVLANGARSLVFDLEPSDGGSFWEGTPEAALAFGAELRRLQPNAFLSVAPDPRPWQVAAVPVQEFATFCNEIAPQAYWPMFSNSATYRLLRDWGYDVPDGRMTPEFVLDMSHRSLSGFGLPIKPVGSASQGGSEFWRFLVHAQDMGMSAVSAWRFGTSSSGVWDVLGQHHPLPNDYYGPDWGSPPPAASTPDSPKGLAALPETPPPRDAEAPVRALKAEGTSFSQPSSLETPAGTKLNPFDVRLHRSSATKKSFWADPTGASR
jgi:hypothetical protein